MRFCSTQHNPPLQRQTFLNQLQNTFCSFRFNSIATKTLCNLTAEPGVNETHAPGQHSRDSRDQELQPTQRQRGTTSACPNPPCSGAKKPLLAADRPLLPFPVKHHVSRGVPLENRISISLPGLFASHLPSAGLGGTLPASCNAMRHASPAIIRSNPC